MRYVRALSAEEREELERLHRVGATHRERSRAQAVLLSARGYGREVIADIVCASADTVSTWLERFESGGALGLCDLPKSGRPPKLDAQATLVVAADGATSTSATKAVFACRRWCPAYGKSAGTPSPCPPNATAPATTCWASSRRAAPKSPRCMCVCIRRTSPVPTSSKPSKRNFCRDCAAATAPPRGAGG